MDAHLAGRTDTTESRERLRLSYWPMIVDKIAIACFRKDLALLRTCVASVRYWYPDVDIYLIKDTSRGEFSTSELERFFNVRPLPADRAVFGWGWAKLSLLLKPGKERFLVLDSDTVFLGKVLDRLAEYDDDFIVTGISEPEDNELVSRDYINMARIRSFDPTYRYPGFAFNSGQMVVTSGIIQREDLEPLIEFEPVVSCRNDDIFRYADQGVLNYVLARAQEQNRATVRYVQFWIWPGVAEAARIDLEAIRLHQGIPYILHWAGAKPTDFRKVLRRDVLDFFEEFYYSRLPMGKIRRGLRGRARLGVALLKIVRQRVLRWKKSHLSSGTLPASL